MNRESIKLIKENVDVDYIEDNPEGVYEILQEMCEEFEFLQNRLDCANEQIEPWHNIAEQLNKENKMLIKRLAQKYEQN